MPISGHGERSKRKRSKKTATKKSSHITLSANASIASLGSASQAVPLAGDVIQIAGAAVSNCDWYIFVY
jgi:hypothetical protein